MEARRIDDQMPIAQRMEHRWGRRIDCGASVQLSVGDGVGGAGRLRNVSTSGAFVETALELHLLTRIVIRLRDVEILAAVARIGRDGVGVEWCETPARAICPILGCTHPCAAATRPQD
jgi:hypothetical protein